MGSITKSMCPLRIALVTTCILIVIAQVVVCRKIYSDRELDDMSRAELTALIKSLQQPTLPDEQHGESSDGSCKKAGIHASHTPLSFEASTLLYPLLFFSLYTFQFQHSHLWMYFRDVRRWSSSAKQICYSFVRSWIIRISFCRKWPFRWLRQCLSWAVDNKCFGPKCCSIRTFVASKCWKAEDGNWGRACQNQVLTSITVATPRNLYAHPQFITETNW